MEGQERPEITPENKDEQLKLKPGEFAFADKYGMVHTAGSFDEFKDLLESYQEEDK